MVLKPQDVVVLLKLVALGEQPWTFQRLAVELSISQSEVHAAVNRAVAAKLMSDAASTTGRPLRPQLLEFLLHGVTGRRWRSGCVRQGEMAGPGIQPFKSGSTNSSRSCVRVR